MATTIIYDPAIARTTCSIHGMGAISGGRCALCENIRPGCDHDGATFELNRLGIRPYTYRWATTPCPSCIAARVAISRLAQQERAAAAATLANASADAAIREFVTIAPQADEAIITAQFTSPCALCEFLIQPGTKIAYSRTYRASRHGICPTSGTRHNVIACFSCGAERATIDLGTDSPLCRSCAG